MPDLQGNGGMPAASGREHPADHHADREGCGGGSCARSRTRRGRLRDEAVFGAGAREPHSSCAPPSGAGARGSERPRARTIPVVGDIEDRAFSHGSESPARREIRTTPSEFKLLALLAAQPNRRLQSLADHGAFVEQPRTSERRGPPTFMWRTMKRRLRWSGAPRTSPDRARRRLQAELLERAAVSTRGMPGWGR